MFKVLAAVLGAVCLAAGGTVVSPASYAAVEGNLGSNIPTGHTELTFEQAYSASLFGSSPVLITAVAFRPDGTYGFALSAAYTNLVVQMSTTSAAPGALNSSFAANFGADQTTVLSSPSYNVSTAKTGPSGGPYAFDIVLTFDTPFVYNPALGNLLLYIRMGTGGADQSLGLYVDAENQSAVGGGSLYAFSSTSATGGNANTEVITEFLTSAPTATPEPATFGGAAAALGAVVLAKLQRKK